MAWILLSAQMGKVNKLVVLYITKASRDTQGENDTDINIHLYSITSAN